MNPEEWQKIKEVVAGALELGEGERRAFLENAALDPEERQRVDAYLVAYGDEPDFLEEGIGWLGEREGPAPAELRAGELADGYRIVRKIGEGGMGEVYEAEQLEPMQRRVALKLLRTGHQHARGIARFEAERQSLASMDHRNIARVFAGGDMDGRPYLAMELVDGEPIHHYCDRRRLGIDARVELFVDICRGVQHAHQRGIIHRDLKPSNILVAEEDGQPVPKVIDFGISKATNEGDPRQTEHGQWLGTPDYMSPEQATGAVGTVDTRSDVYALGVLLYFLLTGRLPFAMQELRRQGLDVLLRTLRQTPPVRPSRRCGPATQEARARAEARGSEPAKLERRLRGDLDWVVLRALEKEPENRYASPHDLAEDLRRHLEHRPLLATGQSTAHTLRKLLRRHRLAVATAGLVLVVLVAGVIGTSVGLLRARTAEREAERRAIEARAEAERANREAATATKVTDFMWEVFRASDPADPGNHPGITLRQVLDRGAERVRQELGDEPRVQARLMTAIGQSYVSLGSIPEGRALIEEAVERLEELAPGSHELAQNLNRLGEVHTQLADYETSLAYFERALEMFRRVHGERHGSVAAAMHDMGKVLAYRGELEAAIRMLEECLELKIELYGEDHPSVARTLNSVGLRRIENEEPELALPLIEKSLETLERHLGPEHPDLSPTLNNLAMAHWRLASPERAEQIQLRALAIDEEAFGSEHPYVGLSLLNLAYVAWEARRDCPVAIERMGRTVAIFEQHYPAEHPKLRTAAERLTTYREECGHLENGQP